MGADGGATTKEASAPIAAPPAPRATVRFLPDWSTSITGDLRPGGRLSVDYDWQRLPRCRSNANGLPAWDIYVFMRFHPGGEVQSANLIRHLDGNPPQVILPSSADYEVSVPADATQVEIWFQNADAYGCSAWDSRFGQNYWFDVGPAAPAPPVSYRTGARTSPEMVNVVSDGATKANVFPGRQGPRQGVDYQSRISVHAWVRNLAYTKYVWADAHVFDGLGELLHSQTLPLAWWAPAGGGGDLFVLDVKIYQGSIATPGSVTFHPDARTVQYRLYYEVDGQVYTDGVLHEHQLPEDTATP